MITKKLLTGLLKIMKKRPLIALPIIIALLVIYILEREGSVKSLFNSTATSLISNNVRVVDGDTIVLDGLTKDRKSTL